MIKLADSIKSVKKRRNGTERVIAEYVVGCNGSRQNMKAMQGETKLW